MALADERLRPLGIPLYVMLGNDDPAELRAVLDAAPWGDARRRQGDRRSTTTTSSSRGATRTSPPGTATASRPRRSWRARFDALVAPGRRPAARRLQLHVPPYEAASTTRPCSTPTCACSQPPGQVKFAPVGSTAVRDAIERDQPLLELHGHIHESSGIRRIGRTIAINPGSDYGTGRAQRRPRHARAATRSGPPARPRMMGDGAAVAARADRRRAPPAPGRGRSTSTAASSRGPPSLPDRGAAAGLGRAGRRPTGGRPALAALAELVRAPRPAPARSRDRPHRPVPVGRARRRSAAPGRAGPDLSRQPGRGRGARDPRAVRRRGDARADRPPAGGVPRRAEAALAARRTRRRCRGDGALPAAA